MLCLVLSLVRWTSATTAMSQPPHFVLIVADDLGRADVGTADPSVISPVRICMHNACMHACVCVCLKTV